MGEAWNLVININRELASTKPRPPDFGRHRHIRYRSIPDAHPSLLG